MRQRCIVMDETDAPYEEGKSTYKRTLDDDLFLVKMAERDGLEFKPEGRLAKIQAEK